jgi:hypothetical protein
MATPFPFVAGDVLTAAELNAITELVINDKTDSYTLVAGDAGERVIMNKSSATTITVPNSVFVAGQMVFIANKGTGVCTVTAGAGTTVSTSGSLALAQYGGGTLLALSASTFIFFPGGGISYGTATGGTSLASPPSGYAGLQFTTDGTLTVTKAGLFDLLLVGGGGGGGGAQGNFCGGGGGGGGILGLDETLTVYLEATTYTIDVGAGGAGSDSSPALGKPSMLGQAYIVYGGGKGGSYAQTTSASDGAILFRVGGAGANSGGHANAAAYRDYSFSNGDRRIGAGLVTNTYEGGAGRNDFATGESSGAGGGGGAGGAGGNAATNTGGNGGNGRDISAWIGGSTYYAGAGAGGAGASTAGSAGNGGVAGLTSGTGNNGVNYGAAGGGTRNASGGNGAAGAVFIRWEV